MKNQDGKTVKKYWDPRIAGAQARNPLPLGPSPPLPPASVLQAIHRACRYEDAPVEAAFKTYNGFETSLQTLTMAPATLPSVTDNASNGTSSTTGPHPGKVNISKPYLTEQEIRVFLQRVSSGKEESSRIEGVKMIDKVRKVLQLPIRTYTTACVFFHKFRLNIGDLDYNWQDGAMTCLWFACKTEDTLKKSREILAAAYNLKEGVGDPRSPDDKVFEKPSQVLAGLERLCVEAIGFDFRVRFPQKILTKMMKDLLTEDVFEKLFPIAWLMSMDMYATFIPLKQTTFTMAFAIIQVVSLVTRMDVPKLEPDEWYTTRGCVVETMLDLLDLYTQHHKHTKLAGNFTQNEFIEVKIQINKEIESGPTACPRYQNWCNPCETDPRPALTNIPAPTELGRDHGTNRFLFDADEARREKEIVDPYFEDEYEEVEVEVEETIPEAPPDRPRDRPRESREHRGHGRGYGQGPVHGVGYGHHGGGRHDGGWYPGPGGGGGRVRHDRRRRGGGGFY